MLCSCQDVADLAEECEDEIQESKGSVRLGRRVDAMIGKLDTALLSLETEGNATLKEMREERLVELDCSKGRAHSGLPLIRTPEMYSVLRPL